MYLVVCMPSDDRGGSTASSLVLSRSPSFPRRLLRFVFLQPIFAWYEVHTPVWEVYYYRWSLSSFYIFNILLFFRRALQCTLSRTAWWTVCQVSPLSIFCTQNTTKCLLDGQVKKYVKAKLHSNGVSQNTSLWANTTLSFIWSFSAPSHSPHTKTT